MNSAPAAMIYQSLRSALAFASGKKPSKSKGGFTAPQILLQPSPSLDWDLQFEKLLKSEFLKSKYNRRRRLTEKWAYLTQYLQINRLSDPGTTVDIGLDQAVSGMLSSLGYQIQGRYGMERVEWENEYPIVETTDAATISELVLRPARLDGPGRAPGISVDQQPGSIEQACQHLMAGVPHHNIMIVADWNGSQVPKCKPF